MNSKKDTQDDDIMTLDDIASYINVKPTRIIHWIKNYEFPSHIFLGSYVFNLSEVNAWISKHETQTKSVVFTVIQEPQRKGSSFVPKLSDTSLYGRLMLQSYKAWGNEPYLVFDIKAGCKIAKKLNGYVVAYCKERSCMVLVPDKFGYKFKKYKDWTYHTLNVKIPVSKVPQCVIERVKASNNVYKLVPVLDNSGNIILDFTHQYKDTQ